jgi:hypothetical protein
MQDEALQILQKYLTYGTWPENLKASEIKYTLAMKEKLFQDKNKIIWVSLNNYN